MIDFDNVTYSENLIDDLLEKLKRCFNELLEIVSSFQVLEKEVMPLGPPKAHTRSVSWLAEQVLVQNLIYQKEKLGIDDVSAPESDIAVYDVQFKFKDYPDLKIYVNLKISDYRRSDNQTNDISEITKMIDFLLKSDSRLLFNSIFKIKFEGFRLKLDAKDPIIFFIPWMSKSDYRINISQHKIQAPYKHQIEKKSPFDFLNDLIIDTVNPRTNVALKTSTYDNLEAYHNYLESKDINFPELEDFFREMNIKGNLINIIKRDHTISVKELQGEFKKIARKLYIRISAPTISINWINNYLEQHNISLGEKQKDKLVKLML